MLPFSSATRIITSLILVPLFFPHLVYIVYHKFLFLSIGFLKVCAIYTKGLVILTNSPITKNGWPKIAEIPLILNAVRARKLRGSARTDKRKTAISDWPKIAVSVGGTMSNCRDNHIFSFTCSEPLHILVSIFAGIKYPPYFFKLTRIVYADFIFELCSHYNHSSIGSKTPSPT